MAIVGNVIILIGTFLMASHIIPTKLLKTSRERIAAAATKVEGFVEVISKHYRISRDWKRSLEEQPWSSVIWILWIVGVFLAGVVFIATIGIASFVGPSSIPVVGWFQRHLALTLTVSLLAFVPGWVWLLSGKKHLRSYCVGVPLLVLAAPLILVYLTLVAVVIVVPSLVMGFRTLLRILR